MKNIYYILTMFLLSLFSSCGDPINDTGSHETIENNVDTTSVIKKDNTKGLREFSLKDFELEIVILVPEKFHTDEDDLPRFNVPEVIHNNGEARWEIKMPGDKHWHLVIEDLGKALSSVKKEKEDHKFTDFFDYKYYKETENVLLYSRILKADNSTLEAKEIEMLPNYHLYCKREINGYNIVFRSHEMGDYRKVTIEKMLVSAMNSK